MADVWYCQNRRCRRVVRCEPEGAIPRGCRCKTPVIGLMRCRVYWNPEPATPAPPPAPKLVVLPSPEEPAAGPELVRGQTVWTRRMEWDVIGGADVQAKHGSYEIGRGRPLELTVRRASRSWLCTACDSAIPKGTLHGSAFYEHYCVECVTAVMPATQWRPVQ
jgi:hypothetical protein